MTKNNKQGFTLIELLVVVALIATVSAVVLATLQSARQKTYNTIRNDNVEQLANAINLYLTNNSNTYPSSGGSVVGTGAWACVGLDSGNCWSGTPTGLPSLNTKLKTVMARIPKDPTSGSMYSDYYVYNSTGPAYSTQASYTTGGGVGTGSNPVGAQLSWVVRNLGQSSPCGKGYPYMFIGAGNTQIQCILYLGQGNL